MPDMSDREAASLLELIKDAIPLSLSKENEDKAKEEYEEYKLNKELKKIEELNPLTIYFIIKDLNKFEQISFIKEHIDFIRKNDESVFLYNMMAPESLSTFLSYEALKEIYNLDKNIFCKILNGNVENLIVGFSYEEIVQFYDDYSKEIIDVMDDFKFVNFWLFARRYIYQIVKKDNDNLANAFKVSKEKCAKLTDFIIGKYGEKISKLDDYALLGFFENAIDKGENSISFNKFVDENRERLKHIYKTIANERLWDSFEGADLSAQKIIFDNFGDVIVNRTDFSEFMGAVKKQILCELYKKNKNPFKNIDIKKWLHFEISEDLKKILDDYKLESVEEILNSKGYARRSTLEYLENKHRKGLNINGIIVDIDENTSIFSNDYLKNIEEIKVMLKNRTISKNSDIYKKHFALFTNYLIKKNVINEVNENNFVVLERFFSYVIRGGTLVKVKQFNNINEIAIFNRVRKFDYSSSSEFSLEQIQKYNVKEHKKLCEKCESRWLRRDYNSMALKLMLMLGYERADYILSLDNSLTTLEHLVGNVDIRNIKLDNEGNPILNTKIINLLFKDLHKNRIELMLKDKDNDLYKYFPRIFNEWDNIVMNNKHKSLKTIIEFLKSDEVSVDIKHYRLKGLFKYIGCKNEIVQETMALHDMMLERVNSTIPRVKGEVGEYTYEVLKLHDMEGLTVGNKTDCCFTVKGNAYSSLIHALTNKNGRILVVKKNGELIAHSWLWRNGNVLCLDSIEIFKSMNSVDFLEVYEKFADDILKESYFNEGEKAIKNITIGIPNFSKKIEGIGKYPCLKVYETLVNGERVVTNLPMPDSNNIYSDAKTCQILLRGKGDFKYYDSEACYYDERYKVLEYASKDEISEEKLEKMNNIINALRYIECEEKGSINNFERIDVSEYKKTYCNYDWFVLVDKDDNVEKYALFNDERVKEEIKSVLNIGHKNVVKK